MRPNESFIEQPVRSLQTMLRVISEDDRRMPSIISDGVYGPSTMNTVSAFQRLTGLPVTGTADQTTWERIVSIYEQAVVRVGKAAPIEIIMDPGEVFHVGDSNPYIFLLQGMLAQLSLDTPSIPEPTHNGFLDEHTSASLAAFQLLAALPVTGELDKVTWKHLVKHFTLNAHHNTATKRQLDQGQSLTTG